jgi:ribulose-phosphate 3-epimerase
MKIHLGIKTDPIQNRYSYDWLFRFMEDRGIPHLQLGGFFELPLVDDGFFLELRKKALRCGIRIKSVFSSHRETSGFFYDDKYMEKAARLIYEKFIHAGSLVGAAYVGTSAGSLPRDLMDKKETGIERYFFHMKELMHLAKEKGLEALTIEVMSCSAEPPVFPEEIDRFTTYLSDYHEKNPKSTVPVYLLGDISHGFADRNEKVIYDNYELFEHSIPRMCEFHFKNTDAIFNSTFGFSEKTGNPETDGIVDLARLRAIVDRNESKWPVAEVTGYLEIPGPKLGRDYSDYKLENMLHDSFEAIKKHF